MASSSEKASDSAIELVKELRAMEESHTAFGAYSEWHVQEAIRTIQSANSVIDQTTANPFVQLSSPYYAAYLEYHRAAALRGKRCLCAYWKGRQDALTTLWWEGREHEAHVHCTDAERGFLRGLDSLLVGYMQCLPVPLDLRSYATRPPCSPPTQVVRVRGKKNYSYVSPSTMHAVTVYDGKLCSIAIEDAELLLQHNVVELVDE